MIWEFFLLFLPQAVLLRGLDALTTEDSVLKCLHLLTKLPIKALRIGRDSLTNTSRGICYVEMNSVVDAMFLHNQLLGEPATVDDKILSVSYFRTPESGAKAAGGAGGNAAAASAALAAAKWSNQVGFFLLEHFKGLCYYIYSYSRKPVNP